MRRTSSPRACVRDQEWSQEIGLKDLQKGWRVVVNYDTDLQGAAFAKLIEVVATPIP